MALSKNKTEIYSNVYNLKFELDIDVYYYDDWGYDDEYCTGSCCYVDYSITESVYKTYIHKRFGRVSKENMLIGQLIDMDNIYEIGTDYYRERMLNRLLGIETFSKDNKTTLGDYFNISNYG